MISMNGSHQSKKIFCTAKDSIIQVKKTPSHSSEKDHHSSEKAVHCMGERPLSAVYLTEAEYLEYIKNSKN